MSKNTTLILPCAGKSTRFPGSRPKYLQTMPNGDLMVISAINNLKLTNVAKIVITVVKEHIETSNVDLAIIANRIFQLKAITPEFLILDNFTSSQSETVAETIKRKSITGGFFIKDCDNLFNFDIGCGNYVCTSKLDTNTNAVNKAYIKSDKFGNVSGIIEKKVINDIFCCGGYSFDSADEFVSTYDKVVSVKSIDAGEIYISHIIQQMILDTKIFGSKSVSGYIDLGTAKDWNSYVSQFKTVFIDIDGVIVENGSEFFSPKWGECKALTKNVETINELYATGCVRIILTTARKKTYEKETIRDLDNAKVNYDEVIFELPHAQRVLVNDFGGSNKYPSAVAINIKRDTEELSYLLK